MLGLTQANDACRALDSSETRLVTRSTNRDLFTVGRGSSRLTLISEAGRYYRLVMRSRRSKIFSGQAEGQALPGLGREARPPRDPSGWRVRGWLGEAQPRHLIGSRLSAAICGHAQRRKA